MKPFRRPLRASFTTLALLLVTACSHFDGADAPAEGEPDGGAVADDAGDGGMKAMQVTGTPPNTQITEQYGFFVAPSGNDSNAGTRAKPFATIAAGTAAASQAGKIVYVCTGSYAEAVVVVDSISIIGGLDCADSDNWKTGAAPSHIASPSSPAITATSITSATRLESLDVVAPSATAAGASSIGLFAVQSPGITVANSTITAGNGANGTNGADAIQLQAGPNVAGGASPRPGKCNLMLGICYNVLTHLFVNGQGGSAGVGSCAGATGHDGGAGGYGGSGGVWQAEPPGTISGAYWSQYESYAGFEPGGAGTGASGAPGVDGAAPSAMGTLTSSGYTPQDGSAGSDGSPGAGGHGGTGGSVVDVGTPNAAQYDAHELDQGMGGAGGGAGGCPGLAGGPGTGGGASLGVALVESPITLDGVTIASATGGAGGLGSFGSDPTAGGAAGANFTSASPGAAPGGNGGTAGVSTNGSSGPSIGILVSGAAPTSKNKTTATPGSGGAAIDARTHTDALGNTRTIPATPAGLAIDTQML